MTLHRQHPPRPRHAANFGLMAIVLAAAPLPLLSGCNSGGPNGPVPGDAILRAESTRGRVVYTTNSGGTAYVSDGTDHRVVWSGPVRGGVSIVVDVPKDTITVGDQVVRNVGLHAGHTYRIFLDPTIR